MTIVDWIPLVVAALSIFGAAGTYAYQRRVDRTVTLLENRREVYASYVLAIQKSMTDLKNNGEYQSSLVNTFIFGTDDVVRTVAEFHDEVADKAGNINSPRATTAYVRMVAAMRKDCFESSKLSIEEMKQLVPFR